MAAWRSAGERTAVLTIRLHTFAALSRGDQPTAAVIRGEDAVVAGEVGTRFGHQGSQTGNEIDRFEGAPGCNWSAQTTRMPCLFSWVVPCLIRSQSAPSKDERPS